MPHQELINKIFRLYPYLLLALLIVFIFSHTIYSIFSPIFIGENKVITIYPGSKISSIGQSLEKESIIRSSFYFKLLVGLRKSTIKAGIYEFNGFYNLLDIVKILEKGGRGVKITITEGMTLKEIEKMLKEKGFDVNFSKFKIGDFSNLDLKNYFKENIGLEGFLAPDTYEFFPNDNERTILEKILKNFSNKYMPELLKGVDLSLYERLILASIVEKEAKVKDDFPVIAGILIKRLKMNHKLEADATLIYEKCGFIFCNTQLTKQDLLNNSDYNTYKINKLPPTPISNPGILAINSVNNPINTDYLFYLTDKDGKAVFSKDLKEHTKNIKKFIKDNR
jgi:UPF0755 protein